MKSGQRLIAILFAAAIALLTASIMLTYRSGLVVVRAQHKLTSKLETISKLNEFLSSLKDAETGQRGYLITGDTNYLAPYEQGRAELRATESQLGALVTAGELPKSKLDSLFDLADRKLAELDRTIKIRKEQGQEPAVRVVQAGLGKQIMDGLREEVAQVNEIQQQEFQDASRSLAQATVFRSVTFAVAALINIAFLYWAYKKISRESRIREAGAMEIIRQKEVLATTLRSIGDGVIMTNVEGQVTFLNAEAERLTGWRDNEAAGRLLSEIFRIIHEETRKTAENPVDKVLRLGTVVGLANHTLLIAKDGRETPIDDSAAPIREAGKPLFGVVLVFRDFTEQKKNQQMLAKSKIELERTVEVRTAELRQTVHELEHVSYAITHDMRAPLRAMTAYAQVLLEDEPGAGISDEGKDYLNRIVVAATRLDKLILDALNYTKAVLRAETLEPVDLGKFMQGLLRSYPNLNPDVADIRIIGQLPLVIGRDSLLTQCFSNLLGNAVKFVAPGVRPKVMIRSEIRGRIVRIWVEDNGIGIPEDARERLFEMFERLSGDYEGTGIGLAIVRKVVERMNGSVGVESRLGEGSRFWVDLQLAEPANPNA